MKRFVFVLIAALMALSMSMQGLAKTSTPAPTPTPLKELQKQQKENQQKMKNAKDSLNEAKEQKDDALIQIAELDALMDEAEMEYGDITAELGDTQTLLDQTEKELAEATDSREKQYEAFKVRISYLYENGDTGYLEAILTSRNVTDFLDMMEYINNIVEYDKTLLESLRAVEKSISEKTELIRVKTAEIQLLAEQQRVKLEALEAAMNNKNELVAKLESTESSLKEQIEKLEKTNDTIEKLILQSQTSSGTVYYTGGKLGMPVNGARLTSQFGIRVDPITKKAGDMHRGVDFAIKTGTPVYAAEAGVVITAEYLSSYGYCVIIDHGGGMSTLYAHNSALIVSKGQKVTRGQQIAKVGSTGYSTGPHCHFEVRINGVATDPLPYLK